MPQQVGGIVCPSGRDAPGQCIAALLPHMVGMPTRGDHVGTYRDGSRVSRARRITDDRSIPVL